MFSTMDYAEYVTSGNNAPPNTIHELSNLQMDHAMNGVSDITQIALNYTYDDFNLRNITQTMLMDAKKKNHSVMISSIMFASGFMSNMLALFVLIRSQKIQKKTIFYKLVAGLTLTDLLGTSLTSPIVISVYMNNFKWIGGTSMCNFFAFEMIFSSYSTMLIVCMMAVERVLSIKHPYYFYTRMTTMHAFMFLFGCWGFAAVMASLPLMGFGNIVLKFPWTWCFLDYYSKDIVHKAYNYLFASLALIIISITVICNIAVMYTLIKTNKKQYYLQTSKGETRRNSGNARRNSECQMLVLLVGITVVFSTCYIPLMVRVVMNQTGLFLLDRKTDLLMIRLASLNQILDPWVYILFRLKLTKKLSKRSNVSLEKKHSTQKMNLLLEGIVPIGLQHIKSSSSVINTHL